MIGNLKGRLRNFIARHRASRAVQYLHRTAKFVEDAYRNEGTDFESNGERDVVEAFARFDFRTVFDVGANAGSWSIAVASTWTRSRVHAFEIAPETANKFRQNLAQHRSIRNVELHLTGLSDQPGTQAMFYYPGHDDLTCSTDRFVGRPSVPFLGVTTTIDQFCLKHGIDFIDFLKIDVEGDEHKVLEGAQACLRADRIGCIQFEYGAFSLDSLFLLKHFYAMLGPKYRIGKIFPGRIDFRDYDWQMDDHRFCNYLCVPRDRQDLIQALSQTA